MLEEEENEHPTMQFGKRNTKERVMKEIPPPRSFLPTDDQLFRDGLPDVDFLKTHLFHEGKLKLEQALRIVKQATGILTQEPTMVKVPAPLVICGDIHGQYYDLLRLFEVAGGAPPDNRFLFLGDYVDRGYFSVECTLLLLSMKICHPEYIFLLRGNHECRHLTRHFTFHLECTRKYGESLYSACMEAFDAMPMAAIASEQFFCVHGGLGPDLRKLKQLVSTDRFCEPPRSGLLCDLLWSDPTVNYGEGDRWDSFLSNSSRGCSYRFSFRDCTKFLDANGLMAVVRGHEAQAEGYRLYHPHPKTGFPTLITLFSAPNYADVYGNKGAIMVYDGHAMNIRQFEATPHPFHLPRLMDAFDWSLPFVAESVVNLLLAILNIPSMQSTLNELDEAGRAKLAAYKEQKMLAAEVQEVARLGRLLASERLEREAGTELVNAVGATVASAPESLTDCDASFKSTIQSFEQARLCDRINEMEPAIIGLEDDASSVSSAGSIVEPEPSQCLMELAKEVVGADEAQHKIEAEGRDPLELIVETLHLD